MNAASPSAPVRVALCQLNSVVGDIRGNAEQMRLWYERAVAGGADLVVFPEMALTGYPPRDLLELSDFLSEVETARERLAAETGAAGLVFGLPLVNPGDAGKRLTNGAVFCTNGKILHRVHKHLLPTYDVFDEGRHFEPDAAPAQPVSFAGISWGLHVCEDAWNEEGYWPRRLYHRDPVAELAENGAEVLLNISASPFHAHKISLRRTMFASHSRRHRLPFLYTNSVGGNDELVFDGEAYVFASDGSLLASGRPFSEEMLYVEVSASGAVRPLHTWTPDADGPSPTRVHPEMEELASVKAALLLGLRDYARKCGFTSAVLGLSGGIDSALTAALAAEALGPDRVWGIALPSRYSSEGSLLDAKTLADNLGIHHRVMPIEDLFQASLDTLKEAFQGTSPGTAEENLQARARGLLLMALSNKFGHLLLATGNKSELAVGYCTLYGDMAGGLTLISDLPKTTVYALARYLNEKGEIIPESTLTKPPSAELRPDQTDQDSLPPYDLLDRILEGYIEEGKGRDALITEGLPADMVDRIIGMVSRAEYKRWQAAPGIKISPKAFGLGRRMPIAKRWPLK